MKTEGFSDINSDQLLQSYLTSKTDFEAEPILAELITVHAEPLIRKVVSGKISHSKFLKSQSETESEDLCSIIKLKLLTRLRDLRSSPNKKAIRSFLDYVAVAAFNSCNEYYRRTNPAWLRLRNYLRYFLSHHKDFSLWKSGKMMLCGFARWKGRNDICSRDGLSRIEIKDSSRGAIHSELTTIFTKTSLPVRFIDIVTLFSQSSEGKTTIKIEEASDYEMIAIEGKSVDQHLELKNLLQKVWQQISELSVKQRTALLLSLRDENGSAILHFFPMLGIAKIKDLAILLEMQPENFAAIWRDLPLDDNEIARYLQITRQQVINLRKCAKERLARKFK